jgi:hypothetical protein
MLGSTVLDVAIGVVLIFLGVSLAASAITEAISSALKWREATLLDGIKALTNDANFTGVALYLYNHALFNPLGSGKADSEAALTHRPAYVNSRDFALAFYDVIAKGEADTAALIGNVQDPQLKSALQSLWNAAGQDAQKFKDELGHWFDNAMDRLSGWYKQRTQVVSFAVALTIAAALNANVLYEGARIWAHPALMANIENGALGKIEDAVKACQPKAGASPPAADQAASGQPPACAAIQATLEQLRAADLIGWETGPRPNDIWSWAMAVLSWFIVAGAALFGASFWFDILQRLTQLRGTGLVNTTMKGRTAKPDIAGKT